MDSLKTNTKRKSFLSFKFLIKFLPIFFVAFYSSAQSIEPKGGPEQIKIGAFITALYNIDPNGGVFNADFWVWTLSPKNSKYKMEDSLEINYSSSLFPKIFSNQNNEILNQKTSLQQRKVQGVFLHDFDLEKYPFDTQTLKIYFEDGTANSSHLQYKPDLSSGYDSAISIDGWKIQSVALKEELKTYDSNFGNFNAPNKESYSQAVLNIILERDAPMIFFKLTAGLFLAVFVALCSCFMSTHSEDIFSGRMGLLGGTLLAVVVSQQFVDSKLGETTTVTMIDTLHMLGMTIIMLLLIITGISRILSEKDAPVISSQRLDFVSFGALFSTFVLLSAYTVLTKI